jgi:hypothetical protein
MIKPPPCTHQAGHDTDKQSDEDNVENLANSTPESIVLNLFTSSYDCCRRNQKSQSRKAA